MICFDVTDDEATVLENILVDDLRQAVLDLTNPLSLKDANDKDDTDTDRKALESLRVIKKMLRAIDPDGMSAAISTALSDAGEMLSVFS